MDWKNVKPLKSENLIDEFEQLCGYKFPESFRQCVKENNGGYPEPCMFDSTINAGGDIYYLLSFNKGDHNSIWFELEAIESNLMCAKDIDDLDYVEQLLEIINNYVVFACGCCGDYIAFDRRDDSVAYILHDAPLDFPFIERVADSFEDFLDCLYPLDDEI